MYDIVLWAYTLPPSSFTSYSNFNNNETASGALSTRKVTKPDFGGHLGPTPVSVQRFVHLILTWEEETEGQLQHSQYLMMYSVGLAHGYRYTCNPSTLVIL